MREKRQEQTQVLWPLADEVLDVPLIHRKVEDVEAERQRVYSAFAKMREQIDRMAGQAEFGGDGEHQEVLDTYKMFAYDEGWLRPINEAIDAGEDAAERLRALDAVQGVTVHDGGLDILVTEARQRLPAILEAVSRDGIAVGTVEVVEPDLEAVFLHLTGTALRE